MMLDRQRHEEGVRQIREAGARIRFISDGDVAAALLAVTPAPASTCSGGSAARPRASSRPPRSSASAARSSAACGRATTTSARPPTDAGYDLDEILDADDLVTGDDVFFAATGVTDGDLLQGVRYLGDGNATTESLVMRSRSGTVRRVQATPRPREAARGHRRPLRLARR